MFATTKITTKLIIMYAVFANFLFFNQYLPHIAYYRAAMGGKYYQPSECVVSDEWL